MSHPPTGPAKVPASAATYTPATQDPDLRSQINSLLIREGHAARIQERFLHSLDAHSSNWPSAIQSHALALLRSGEVSTFPALVRRVLDDVRRDTDAATATTNNNNNSGNTQTSSSSSTTTTATAANDPGKDGSANGAVVVNGAGRAVNGGSTAAAGGSGLGADGSTNLAIPTAVVEALLKTVRESLEDVCELDPDGGTGG